MEEETREDKKEEEEETKKEVKEVIKSEVEEEEEKGTPGSSSMAKMMSHKNYTHNCSWFSRLAVESRQTIWALQQ